MWKSTHFSFDSCGNVWWWKRDFHFDEPKNRLSIAQYVQSVVFIETSKSTYDLHNTWFITEIHASNLMTGWDSSQSHFIASSMNETLFISFKKPTFAVCVLYVLCNLEPKLIQFLLTFRKGCESCQWMCTELTFDAAVLWICSFLLSIFFKNTSDSLNLPQLMAASNYDPNIIAWFNT